MVVPLKGDVLPDRSSIVTKSTKTFHRQTVCEKHSRSNLTKGGVKISIGEENIVREAGGGK